jgi:hypothetical protein
MPHGSFHLSDQQRAKKGDVVQGWDHHGRDAMGQFSGEVSIVMLRVGCADCDMTRRYVFLRCRTPQSETILINTVPTSLHREQKRLETHWRKRVTCACQRECREAKGA